MSKHRTTLLQILALAACGLALAGCAWKSVAQATPTATPDVLDTSSPIFLTEKQAQYLEVFEAVWGTVYETYFDPDFGGVDWQAVRDDYLPRALAAADDETFYMLLNEMCFELGVSHIAVIPPDSLTMLEPSLSLAGSVGIDVRLIDDQVVVTAVDPESPAERAGLRAGYILLEVDGTSMENAEELVMLTLPPFNDRRRRGQVTGAILEGFYGEPGQALMVTYLDEENQSHEASIVLEPRTEPLFSGEGWPPMYVGVEAARLEGGIAYIQFDGFLPPVLEDVLAAIQDMRDAPGMIIDIRGNPGGFYEVRKAIISQFFLERRLVWRYITRPGLELPGFEKRGYTDPPAEAYTGPVVVLVDVMSGSSSEEFSGAMQSQGRATIIGERTSGCVLVADMKPLSDGASLLYPLAQTQMADGTVLEGRGVIPDLSVDLDRDSLLRGVDPQLAAALHYLQEAVSDN